MVLASLSATIDNQELKFSSSSRYTAKEAVILHWHPGLAFLMEAHRLFVEPEISLNFLSQLLKTTGA